jgi:squalene-associated FAD-dependent desaturase
MVVCAAIRSRRPAAGRGTTIPTPADPIAIIGGGYAGMAAGVELAARGIPVTLYEAAAQLGGRARAVPDRGLVLDNGLHLLIGAYSETLRLIGMVTPDVDALLLRRPMDWRVLPDFRVAARDLPAPLHLAAGLLLADGASLGEKLSCLFFLDRMRRRQFRLDADTTVCALLTTHRQCGPLERHFWRPLCIAALNTPPERASAQVFLNVLRDGLAAGRAASDLLLPRVDLTALFPDPAAHYIERQGGRIVRSTMIQRIERHAAGFVLVTRNTRHEHTQVICAAPPHRVAALTEPIAELAAERDTIAAFGYEPITSVYLQYDDAPVLPAPMVGFADTLSQWVFDRAALCGQPGLIGVVISASGRHRSLTNEQLAAHVHAELAERLPGPTRPPRWSRVIEEKRATFACVPDMTRPDQATGLPGLYLAGDYTRSDYPATIEAAVRSGVRCAQLAGARVDQRAGR